MKIGEQLHVGIVGEIEPEWELVAFADSSLMVQLFVVQLAIGTQLEFVFVEFDSIRLAKLFGGTQ